MAKTGLLLFDKLDFELKENDGNPKLVASKFRLTAFEARQAARELNNLKNILARRLK